MSNTITGFKTPTCSTCKVADKVADAGGVTINWVDLSTEPETLANIKLRLGKGPTDMIQVPLFQEDGSDELLDITHLRAIVDRANSVD